MASNKTNFHLINGGEISNISNYKIENNEYIFQIDINGNETQIRIPYHAIAYIEVIHIK